MSIPASLFFQLSHTLLSLSTILMSFMPCFSATSAIHFPFLYFWKFISVSFALVFCFTLVASPIYSPTPLILATPSSLISSPSCVLLLKTHTLKRTLSLFQFFSQLPHLLIPTAHNCCPHLFTHSCRPKTNTSRLNPYSTQTCLVKLTRHRVN